jgi:hypothetical protein
MVVSVRRRSFQIGIEIMKKVVMIDAMVATELAFVAIRFRIGNMVAVYGLSKSKRRNWFLITEKKRH